MKTPRVLAFVASLSIFACGAAEHGASPHSLTVSNGVKLNGVKLNGVKLNGVKLNGVKLNGVKLNGVKLDDVKLNGATLEGFHANGALATGAALVGAELKGSLSNGATLRIRIDSVRPGDGDLADVAFYAASYEDAGAWAPLCSESEGGEAILLAGTWNLHQGVSNGGAHVADPNAFTFACRGAALAKCAEWGYAPWRVGPSGEDLRDHHQTCTRLVRADYCGDGRSFTVDGRTINVYDNLFIQRDEANWSFEGRWAPEGALCVQHARMRAMSQTTSVKCANGRRVPVCQRDKVSWGSDRALLIDEFQSRLKGVEEGASLVRTDPTNIQR